MFYPLSARNQTLKWTWHQHHLFKLPPLSTSPHVIGGPIHFILCFCQVFLQLIDPCTKALHLTLILLSPAGTVEELCWFIWQNLLQFSMGVFYLRQLLEQRRNGVSSIGGSASTIWNPVVGNCSLGRFAMSYCSKYSPYRTLCQSISDTRKPSAVQIVLTREGDLEQSRSEDLSIKMTLNTWHTSSFVFFKRAQSSFTPYTLFFKCQTSYFSIISII